MKVVVELIRTVILGETRRFATLRETLLATYHNNEADAEVQADPTLLELLLESSSERDAREERRREGELRRVLRSLEQTTCNLLAVGLHHLLDQHDKFFYSKATAYFGIHRVTFNKSLRAGRKVRELQLVAGVVKHGDEGSAAELKHLRKDLFVDPTQRRAPSDEIVLPMRGEGLYVSEQDLITYQNAVEDLWSEVASIHESGGTGPPDSQP